MQRPFWPWLCACTLLWFGCGRVVEAGETALADQAANQAKVEPFYGVIKAEITDNTGLLAQEIRYTIAPQRIRREARGSGLLDQAIDKALNVKIVAGVIGDLEKREVIVYHEYLDEKHFVRLSLGDYRTWISQRFYDDAFRHYGCSTHFCLLSDGVPSSAKRESAAVVIQDRTCDRLLVDTDKFSLDVAHCPEIQVDRELLRLAEANIPDEVSGFPCQVRVVKKMPGYPIPSSSKPSRARQLLRQGFDQAARALEKVFEEKVYRVVEICHEDVSGATFSPPDGFVEDKDLAAFRTHLDKASGSGGGHHWD